jgi:hypothetical protein
MGDAPPVLDYSNCTWWPPMFAGGAVSCWNVPLTKPIDLTAPIGAAYEKAQYGKIPLPGDLPAPPVPGVVDAGQTPTISAADWAAFTQSQRDAIAAAEANGSYNPAGNLSLNAIDLANFWARYGTAVTILGVGLLGYAGWKVATR